MPGSQDHSLRLPPTHIHTRARAHAHTFPPTVHGSLPTPRHKTRAPYRRAGEPLSYSTYWHLLEACDWEMSQRHHSTGASLRAGTSDEACRARGDVARAEGVRAAMDIAGVRPLAAAARVVVSPALEPVRTGSIAPGVVVSPGDGGPLGASPNSGPASMRADTGGATRGSASPATLVSRYWNGIEIEATAECGGGGGTRGGGSGAATAALVCAVEERTRYEVRRYDGTTRAAENRRGLLIPPRALASERSNNLPDVRAELRRLLALLPKGSARCAAVPLED